MAWNGSDRKPGNGIRLPKNATKDLWASGKRFWIYVFLFTVTILIVLLAWLKIWSRQNHAVEDDQSDKDKLISDVGTNAVVKTTNEIPVIVTTPQPFTKGMNGKVEVDEVGTKWFNGSVVPQVRLGTRYRNGVPINRKQIFAFRSERILNNMLTRTSGFNSSAKWKHPERLEADFKESLKAPIVIKPDDDEDTKSKKELMIEAKKEIQDRMRSGESFFDILKSTSDELRTIARNRAELRKIQRQMTKEGASPEKIAEHIEVSNTLLKEWGARPIKVPSMIKNKIEKEQ